MDQNKSKVAGKVVLMGKAAVVPVDDLVSLPHAATTNDSAIAVTAMRLWFMFSPSG